MMRQVPLRPARERLRPVYNYRRQDRTDKYPDNACTTTVAPRRLRGRQVPRRDPEHLRNVNYYFHYERVPLHRSELDPSRTHASKV